MVSPTLGDLEHRVLDAVDKLGKGTVRGVFEALGGEDLHAYTTIATVLDRLREKGLVARERDGRVLVYRVTRRKEPAERARARGLIERLLGADRGPAVARLVDAVEAIDPALLDRLADEVAARRRARRRGS